MSESNGNSHIAPERDEFEVAIVGTGFSGLGAAIRLQQEGIDDYVILERAGDLGGTWRDNDYPGCCCDVPSHVYSFSFELNPGWTRGFAPQREILDYLRGVARKHDLLRRIRFNSEVTEARWDEQAQRWELATAAGPVRARFLIAGTGGLSDPATPDIPGLERFRGKTFHSARWDHEHQLDGERVAAIGTGASAIQFVPAIQPRVGKLHVFQRTPPWVLPRMDHKITRLEHALLRIPFVPRIVRGAIYWALEVRVVGFRHPRLLRYADKLARAHLARAVRDPELRRKLTPDYTMGCKRILLSDDYYPSLAKPNVEVVTEGISEVREHSIVTADGTEREVDTIIFGTGFHVTDMPVAQRIRGREGRSLAEVWRDGMAAYFGATVAGFPNLFILTGPNTGLGHNSMVFMIESQLNYVLGALRAARRRGAATVEVRREAQDHFNAKLQEDSRGTVWTAGHCRSWYLDEHGRNTALWPRSSYLFRLRTRRFDPARHVLGAPAEPATVEREPAVVGAA